jgi:hypothetical protein
MVEDVHDTDNPALRDYIRQLRNHELAHRRHGQDLITNLVIATNLERYPPLDFSPVITIVDAAPDEEAQLEAAMVRLARRGEYDPMAAELTIATVGLQDTDAVDPRAGGQLVAARFSSSISRPGLERRTLDKRIKFDSRARG